MISGFFEAEGVHFAVVGGLALHAYGLSRSTFDLDIVTEAEVRGPLVAFLESRGYETLHQSAGYSNHLHPQGIGGRIDVVYVRRPTSRKLLGEATAKPIVSERSFPVPRPEHLVAMKLHGMVNDPERRFQDLEDIRFLLHLKDLDREEVRAYFERYDMLDRYRELTDES